MTFTEEELLVWTVDKHKCFSCEESGLILHSECYMLGASVDGRVTCDCCGVGNLEIKCPFSHRDKNIQQYVNQRNSCLAQSTDTVDVDYILKQNHHYYTQVQHQMYVTGALYTDFVVYLPKESAVVRVKTDDCFANISIPQLKQFFYDFIVPEMFTKTIYNRRVCQDTLDSIINKVVQVKRKNMRLNHELFGILSSIITLANCTTIINTHFVKKEVNVNH